MTQLSPLRRRMIEDTAVAICRGGRSRWYLSAVSKFGRYCGRPPARRMFMRSRLSWW